MLSPGTVQMLERAAQVQQVQEERQRLSEQAVRFTLSLSLLF
jgi:hypothetical protein